MSGVDQMTGREFECYVLVSSIQGYCNRAELVSAGDHGGWTSVANQNGSRVAVQCKRSCAE